MNTRNVKRGASLTALALVLATTSMACEASSSGHAESASVDAATGFQPPSDGDDAGAPKAPAVVTTPPPDTITEAQGVFVAPAGDDKGDGSRAHPFASIQAAITHAAQVGKIVFACTGTYKEALVVSDSISVVGGLDCSNPAEWKTGAAPSRIGSPTSPAVTAKSITTATRLESLDIVAPDASEASASSIGLFADHAAKLTVASSKITAGNAANGTDGAKASALTQAAHIDGADYLPFVYCGGASCNVDPVTGIFSPYPGAAGGTSMCVGADGKNGLPGGAGGSGGLWQRIQTGVGWQAYRGFANTAGSPGSGSDGATGADGAVAAELGSLTASGYVAPNGNSGSDGKPGNGGAGGAGGDYRTLGSPQTAVIAAAGGPGGGAGGCPGLAGNAGTGGGASLGVALLESPVMFEDVAIASGAGGAGGLASFGSDPTPGGLPGTNFSAAGGALPGGRGGLAGLSTNGGNGPSIAILVSGAAPILKGTTKATPGKGAPAIAARPTNDDRYGVPRSIPATPAGLSVDIKRL